VTESPIAQISPTNTVALVGLIIGSVTAVAVLLRPYWLLSDILGAAALILGVIGYRAGERTGAGRRLAIWAIVLGLTPLIPLILFLAVRLDYY
jgi:hypothetical protein